MPPIACNWLKSFEQSTSFDLVAFMTGNDKTLMVVINTVESLQTLSFIFTVYVVVAAGLTTGFAIFKFEGCHK